MKKFKHLVGILTACAALLFTFTACNNSFSPQSSDSSAQGQEQQQAQNTNTQTVPVTLETPLTLEAAIAGAVVTFDNKVGGPVTYKVNGGETQTIDSGTKVEIKLENKGDKIEFRANKKNYALKKTSASSSVIYTDFNYSNIKCSADCYIYGNIMSLIKSEDFKDATTLENECAFTLLFNDNTHIKNKKDAELFLPATSLTDFCYLGMFKDCINLTKPSNLPATSLAKYCYHGMFSGCKRLATAPELSATTLKEKCYGAMFCSCQSLVAAPNLPAKNLAKSCYSEMFEGCTGLTTAPNLPATTLANSCYSEMFSGCTRLETAPNLPATSLADFCYSCMFEGCTRLETAPNLPATSTKKYCYQAMFRNCTSLNSVTCLATDISASGCTTAWLNGIASTGTFTKAAGMTDWTEGSSSGIPSGWTIVDKQ